MATLQDRPFARNYSGLVNQTVISGVILVLGTTAFEFMKRARRGRGKDNGKRRKLPKGEVNEEDNEEMGSVETWEFGYLYNGRVWAKNPSPPSDSTWPVYSWVKQALMTPEEEFFRLRGLDAALYIRILKGCFLFCLVQTATTLPILLPIHILFSTPTVARKSLLRASISGLTETSGERFFALHVVLSYWIFISWVSVLVWCSHGLFQYRSQSIQEQMDIQQHDREEHGKIEDSTKHLNRGLRWRTVMVTNIPNSLRNEKYLEEYFNYYMSRPMRAPITQSIVGKSMSFLFRRAQKTATKLLPGPGSEGADHNPTTAPVIEKVVIVRKLTELAALLERREQVLRKLETAHLKLAKTVLQAVKLKLDQHRTLPLLGQVSQWRGNRKRAAHANAIPVVDDRTDEQTLSPSGDEDLLMHILEPFVHEFDVPCPDSLTHFLDKHRKNNPRSGEDQALGRVSESSNDGLPPTIWDALHTLPRHLLDPYQPLIRLKALFIGSTVPSIDYYTTKLAYLSNLIEENRARALKDFTPASTAFVTFESPFEAIRATKYLPSHPDNPLACLTVPAPDVMDLDWVRVMKSAFTGEFIRDWVVNTGVWVFTCLWIIPVTFFVTLVSIQNIAAFIGPLKTFLDHHLIIENIISNFLPTLLVSILAILIPLVLLLIAKKASLILTYSTLHDRIMVRYHKWLVCNLLVFFCVGVTALESILTFFNSKVKVDFVSLVAESYPTAGPFYVGWLIFTLGIHAGLELGLLGLPLIVYPSTKATPLPRKRALGIRPRTLNFYYWLPNHVFVMFLLVVFAVLNPLVIPFGMIYFAAENVVIRNQLLHVYAKPYEGNGRNILIRFSRYSMDGLLLAQVVLLAFFVLNEKVPHAVLLGLLMVATTITKLYLTRLFTRKFVEADVLEAEIVCGLHKHINTDYVAGLSADEGQATGTTHQARVEAIGQIFTDNAKFWTWRFPISAPFTYTLHPRRHRKHVRDREHAGAEKYEKYEKAPSHVESRGGQDTTRTEDVNEGATARKGAMFEGADLTGVSGPTVFAAPTISAMEAQKSGKLVTSHAAHPTWDDTPKYDITYENPFYTRYVENFLWLPRNPFGVLDLDDTVDLHRAISSEPGSDEIGKWLNEMAGLKQMELSDIEFGETPLQKPRSLPTGQESIILSPGIASRIDNEDDVEEAQPGERQSSWIQRRQTSSSSGSIRRPNLRHVSSSRSGMSANSKTFQFHDTEAGPSTDVNPLDTLPRSILAQARMTSSPQMTATASLRPPSISIGRSVTMDDYLTDGSPQTGTASTFSRRRSRQSLLSPRGTLNMISENSGLPGSGTVTTQEAVVSEVLAEEEIEAVEREKEEREEEEKKQKSKRGILTGWMWTQPTEHKHSDLGSQIS